MPACRAPHRLLQAVGVKADGKTKSPPSNEDIINLPSLPRPMLTSAQAWGPTTGQAVATAPLSVTFSQVTERRPRHDMCGLNGIQLVLSGLCQAPPGSGYAVNVWRHSPSHSPSTTSPLPLLSHVYSAVQVHSNTCGRRQACDCHQSDARCPFQGFAARHRGEPPPLVGDCL